MKTKITITASIPLQMEEKHKLFKFSQLFIFQILISLIVIISFQQTFLLKHSIIIGHLFVICCINFLFMVLGLLIQTKKLIPYHKITKFAISGLYGIYIILLYYTYIFSFLGKSFNSRIYTSQIILGYLKHTNGLFDALSVSPLLVYVSLLIIPVLIFIVFLWMSQFINQGFQVFKRFISRHNFNNPPYYIRVNIIVFLLLSGFIFGTVLVKHSSISSRLFRMEEPVVSFFFKNNDPFQGQIISNDNEDIRIRHDYPKNINFPKKNIIIIVIDALRSDHLGLFGYKRKTSPFLDSLYASGNLTKIRLSFSVAGASFAGINGILRSKIWANMGYNNFSLQQLLKDQGYEINFLLSGDHTHFYGLKSFYGKNSDFNYYIDGSTTKKYIIADDRIIFEGLENIKNYQNNPSYFHFHLNSAHDAGIKIDKYKIFKPASARQINIENYTNRYDNGILQADNYVMEIFKRLSLKGYLQNSIVFITADHGEALGERGEFGHVKNVYTDQLLIPILIYDSDKFQYKNTDFATSLDIAPTIVDRLGLPVPESWEGKSILNKTKRAYTFHQMGENYAIINYIGNAKYKYIYNSKTHQQELFELSGDPYETKNIIDSMETQYVNSLRYQLTQFGLTPYK
jgi:glucan phosphoethanolaminetransferase (alkaline phosphatase superfamily)